MAFKFFNIGKANEEIDKLEASVAQLTAERDAIRGNTGQVEAAAEKLKSGLAAADAKIVQLESELSTARTAGTSLTAELSAANAKLANPDERIKEAASIQAAEITAKLGQPPVGASAGSRETADKTMTRAAFGAMSPRAQAEFVKASGKITE